MPAPIDVVFVAFDGLQTLDLTGPHDVFAGANSVLDDLAPDRRRYRLTVASLHGGLISSESGLQISTVAIADVPRRIHTLAIPGGTGTRLASTDRALVDAVADMANRAERILTICSGAFVAAAAGLLDGRRVATHWARAEALARRFPGLDVDPEPIYIHDGRRVDLGRRDGRHRPGAGGRRARPRRRRSPRSWPGGSSCSCDDRADRANSRRRCGPNAPSSNRSATPRTSSMPPRATTTASGCSPARWA